MLYFHFPDEDSVNKLASERSYKNRDVIIVSPAKMGDVYEEKVKMFFNEHLHEDEEIRYIKDGAGFFDVRSGHDQWVRIRMERGDLIVSLVYANHGFALKPCRFFLRGSIIVSQRIKIM